MSKLRVRPAAFALAAGVAAAIVATCAPAQESLRMTIAAQPGQAGRLTVSTDIGVLIFAGGDPLVYEMHVEATQAVEAREVADDGTVTWSSRVVRLLSERDGKPVMRFDADDETVSDPNAAALAEVEVVMQQQPDGRIRDFEVHGSRPEVREKIEEALERSIENSVLMFSKDPVAIGQTWKVGKRTMPFPGVGRVEYDLVATLMAIDRRDDGAQAELRLDSADARFVPDADSKLAGKLSSLRLQGQAIYDIDGSFLRWQESYAFLSVLAPNPEGGMLTLQAYVRIGMQEDRDEE
jgi:hypothetical protein